jgi:hypothetical protein
MTKLYTWKMARADSDRALAVYRRHAYVKRCEKAGLLPYSPNPTTLVCGLLAIAVVLFANPIYA